MKKIYLTTILLLLFKLSQAQWTLSGTGDYYLNSGNASIGTSGIGSKLTVGGSGQSGALVTFSNLVDNGMIFSLSAPGATDKYALLQSSAGGSNLALGVGLSEWMRITNSGFIGMGTKTPQTNLHLMGGFICSGTSIDLDPSQAYGALPNVLANTGQMLIGWNRTAQGGETDFIANSAYGTIGGYAFYNHDSNNNETQLMYIMGNGNVLIGKTIPQQNAAYKLDVNGVIRGNKVVINSTGADFVFKPSYHLMPLNDVSAYINQNHHLPGIQSAKQMQLNGLDVGDNQTKLLQKIEELTLYMIDKDKAIQDQQKLNNKLQEKLQSQQDQIDELKAELKTLIKHN
jgi:hypothetical protein